MTDDNPIPAKPGVTYEFTQHNPVNDNQRLLFYSHPAAVKELPGIDWDILLFTRRLFEVADEGGQRSHDLVRRVLSAGLRELNGPMPDYGRVAGETTEAITDLKGDKH
jgi:hypothetical protein